MKPRVLPNRNVTSWLIHSFSASRRSLGFKTDKQISWRAFREWNLRMSILRPSSNTVPAFVGRDPQTGRERTYVLLNRADNRPHPSVVWYRGGETIVGRQAKQQLSQLGLGVFGDIVRSPKMYLGSPSGVFVGGATRPAR